MYQIASIWTRQRSREWCETDLAEDLADLRARDKVAAAAEDGIVTVANPGVVAERGMREAKRHEARDRERTMGLSEHQQRTATSMQPSPEM